MKAFALICFLILTGCATSSSRYEAKARSWKGKSSENLTTAWGHPDAVEKISEGNKVLVYSRLKRLPVSYDEAESNSANSSHSSEDIYIKCSVYFTINPENSIKSVNFRGDDCTSND